MKVTIDGRVIDVEPGMSVIDAIFHAGGDVPYFCSQEYMSPIGACRMCLARIGAPRKNPDGTWILDEETGEPQIFWFPNLMATCTTSVMEGMVVDSTSKEVKRAQSSMVEFHLINHPLDCPVCDKGGACELQDRAYEYGEGVSRFEFDKRHLEKHHPLSELITLDRERCIHCKRCIRFFEEVPNDEVLNFIERGAHTYVESVEPQLASNFTGNITDICPVGALLDTTSRFRGRNWEYEHTESTGMDDSTGQAVVLDARTGRIERIKAGVNDEVNKSWISDGTRFGHEYADHPARLKTPLVRENGELRPTTWDEAAKRIAAGFAELASSDIGFAFRADSTIEEGRAIAAIAKEFGTSRLDHWPRPAVSLQSRRGATLQDLAKADSILVLGDVTEEAGIVDLRIKDALKGVAPAPLLNHGAPIADLRLKERMQRKTNILTVVAPYEANLMRHGDHRVIYEPGREEAVLGALLAVVSGENVPAEFAESGATLKAAVEQMRGASNGVIVVGGFVLNNPAAAALAEQLANRLNFKELLVGPMANSRGLEYAGYYAQREADGYQNTVMNAKGVFLSHLNPAQAEAAKERLSEAKFLVVHDLFLTETAQLADVVLPATSVYERNGTVMNLEGRLLPVKPAPIGAGTSQDLHGVAKAIGEARGKRLDGRSLRSSRREIRKELHVDLAEVPRTGTIVAPSTRRAAPARYQAQNDGGVLMVPSDYRVEYLPYNEHLLKEHGLPALHVSPARAEEWSIRHGTEALVSVGGVKRRVQVVVEPSWGGTQATLPALPEQPVGSRHELIVLERGARADVEKAS